MGVASQFLGEKEQRHRREAAMLSLVVSIALMVVKFWAHNLTESQAIFSDAVESIVNVLSAFMAIWVIWYSAKPKDADHPYGHGKSEFFSAAFEGGLITFASAMIVVEALHAWWRGEALQRLDWGIVLTSGAGLSNLALGWFLRLRGRRLNSIALTASGAHVISDFWTSVGVVLGLALVWATGLNWIDAAVALIMGLWLGWTGFRLVLESVGGLMDREDPQVLEMLSQVFTAALKPGVIQIHHVKVIRSGWYHHIDAHVVMPEFWEVKKVHDVLDEFERDVINRYEFGGEMNFHVDPCRRVYCQVCDIKDCPIRREAFTAAFPVKIEYLRSPLEPEEFLRRRKS